MRKWFFLLLVLLFSFLFFAELCGQSYFMLFLRSHKAMEPQDYTARTYSMGGMSSIVSRGAEAVFTNPAGMAIGVGEKAEIAVNGDFTIIGNPPQYDDDYYEDQGYDSYEYKYGFRPNISSISFYGPYRFKESNVDIGGGLAWRRFYDLGSSESMSWDMSGTEYEGELGMGSSLNFLTFSGACSYQGKYSGGLSFGMPMFSSHKVVTEDEFDGDKTTSTYEADISGSYFRFGTLLQPVPVVTFGLTYTGGFDIDVEDIEWEIEYPDGSKLEGEDDDSELTIPSFLSVGVLFNPTDMFTLGLEYQTRPWEDFEDDGDEIFEENGYSLRVGGEMSTGSVALRLGYIMDKGPFEDEDEDLVTINTITGGMGLGTETFSVDFGIGYSMANWDATNDEAFYNMLQAKVGFVYNIGWFEFPH